MKRSIPKKIRKEIEEKYGEKCAFSHCNKPANVLHHAVRFAYCKTHNLVVPLCKFHHELAHGGLIENELKTADEWRLRMPKKKVNQFSVDKKWRKFTQKHGRR